MCYDVCYADETDFKLQTHLCWYTVQLFDMDPVLFCALVESLLKQMC